MFKKMIITGDKENKFITDGPEKSESPGNCGCGGDCACKKEDGNNLKVIDNKVIIKSFREKNEGGSCACGGTCGCN